MILGILRETKKGENRVICTPKEVRPSRPQDTLFMHSAAAENEPVFRMKRMNLRERF